MYSVRNLLAGLAVLWLASLPARAEDVGRSWSGFYAGGHGALGRVPLQEDEHDPEGFAGGGQIGFNLQAGRVVAGIEGDLSSGSISDDVSERDPDLELVRSEIEVDQLASVRARLGFTAYDDVLLFATAGYGWAQLESSIDIPAFDIALSDNYDFAGMVYGAGAEYRFSELLSGRIEALRYDLSQEDDSDNDVNIDVVRIGLNVHLPVGPR